MTRHTGRPSSASPHHELYALWAMEAGASVPDEKATTLAPDLPISVSTVLDHEGASPSVKVSMNWRLLSDTRSTTSASRNAVMSGSAR